MILVVLWETLMTKRLQTAFIETNYFNVIIVVKRTFIVLGGAQISHLIILSLKGDNFSV